MTIHCKNVKIDLNTDCPNPTGFCPICEHYEEKEILPYVKVSTVGDLLKVLQEYPHNMRLSKKNCDGSTNASTRFYYEEDKILFGLEGNQICQCEDIITISKDNLKNFLKDFLKQYGITKNFDIFEITDLRKTHYNVDDDVDEFVEEYFEDVKV